MMIVVWDTYHAYKKIEVWQYWVAESEESFPKGLSISSFPSLARAWGNGIFLS